MSKKRNYKVYVHINKSNGKRYYGITRTSVEKRWNNGKGYKNNKHFWNSICKYGWNEGFEHIVIAKGLTEEEAKWLEIELIKEHDTTNQDKGYNISLGGDGSNPSEETRKKLSEAMKEHWQDEKCRRKLSERMKGHEVSEETRKKLSEANKGKHFTEEHRRKLSEANKEHWQDEKCRRKLSESMKGKRHTEETRRKISESRTKQVYVIELDKIFNSVNDCAKFLCCGKSSVSSVLSPKCKHKTIKGYHIIYAEDKNNKELIEEVMNNKSKKNNEDKKKQVYVIELDKIFNSVNDCAEFLCCNQSNISMVLNGNRKTIYGYHIIYAKDKDKLAS